MNVPVQQTKKPRYGLMMARIGSNHNIKLADGIVRSYKVKDKTRHPKVKCVALCLGCNKKHATLEELIADHPDEVILRRQEEKHVYAFWSDDPIDAKDKDPAKVVGLLSTEE